MKELLFKFRFLIVLIFIHLCTIFCIGQAALQANAETMSDEQTAEEILEDNVVDQLEHLDLQELEEYLRSLGYLGDVGVIEYLLGCLKGDAFSYERFGVQFKSIFFSQVKELLPAFACIAAVALLSGFLSSITGGGTAKNTANVVYLICYAVALIPLLWILTQCLLKTFQTIEEMQTQMDLVFPIMLTLMAAGGGGTSIQVAKPAVAFFSTTIVSVFQKIVLPFTMIIFILSMANNLTKDLKIGKFAAFFKGMNKWTIGICVSVFGIFFTLQSLTSSSYDEILRRIARYDIGNGVPIVGGFLSGGFDLAIAGGILIKNTLGSLGVFLMISSLIQPMLLLIATNVLLRLTSAITQPFGDERIANFLGETAETLNYCTASILLTGFMYFLTIVLFVVSTESLL